MTTFDNDLLFPQSANPAFAVDARRSSFEKMRPAIEAMTAKPLSPILVDIATALGTVSGAVQNIQKLRSRIAALTDVSVANVDELPDCVGALAYVNSIYLRASKPPEPLSEMSERGVALRGRLYPDLLRLVERGLLPAGELQNYSGLVGYKIVGNDLMLLGDTAERYWDRIQSKSAITRDEVDEAKRLGFELVTAVGVREVAQTTLAETTQLRLLTYNLLLQHYDEARRAVNYLRWDEGDADKFAPSLYAGRTRRREQTSDVTPDASTNDANGATPISLSPTSVPDASKAAADDAFEG